MEKEKSPQESQNPHPGNRLTRREALLWGLGGIGIAAQKANELQEQAPWGIAALFKNGLSFLANRTVQGLASPAQAASPDKVHNPELDMSKYPFYGDTLPRPKSLLLTGKQIETAQVQPIEFWPSSAPTFKDKCVLEIHPQESRFDWIRMSKGVHMNWFLVIFRDKSISEQDLNVYTTKTLERSGGLSAFYEHFFGLKITNRVQMIQAPQNYSTYLEGMEGADALLSDIRPLVQPLIVNPDYYPGYGLIPVIDNNPDHYDKFGGWGRNLGQNGGECIVPQDIILRAELSSYNVLIHEASHALLGKGDDYSSEDNIMNGRTLFNGNLKYVTLQNIDRICTDPVPRQNMPLVVNQVQ